MPSAVKYASEIRVVPFGKGTIICESLTPILTPEEHARRRREIETRLFEVFVKYTPIKRLHAECMN